MLLILCSWFIIGLTFLSFGDMLANVWNSITKKNDQYSIFDTFWIGICAVGTILLGISIISPLNISITISLVAISIIYWVWKRKKLISLFNNSIQKFKSLSLLIKIAVFLCFIVVIACSVNTLLLYDAGLYHLQSMMWTEQYKIIPGLGNIHGRLGFNSTFLLLSTAFNYQPEYYPAFFSINGLCIFVFSCWLISKINEYKSLFRQLIFAAILVFFIFTFSNQISSTSTDILPSILIIYVLFNCVLSKDIFSNRSLIVGLIPIFCITLKLSSAIIILISLCTLILYLKEKNYKALSMLLGISCIIAVFWCYRFVILTGYLVYPFESIDIFSFDWKMPIETVISEKEAAYAWPRIPMVDAKEVLAMPASEWIPVWLKRQSIISKCFLVLLSVSPLFLLLAVKRKRIKGIYSVLAWITAFIGCIFWFFTAPDFRFGLGMIFSCALIPFLYLSSSDGTPSTITSNKFKERLLYIPSLALIITLLWLVRVGYRQARHYEENKTINISWLYKPQSIHITKENTGITFTGHEVGNTTVYSPDKGDRCFDQCLPCMPYFNDKLEMRGALLEDGFRIKK